MKNVCLVLVICRSRIREGGSDFVCTWRSNSLNVVPRPILSFDMSSSSSSSSSLSLIFFEPAGQGHVFSKVFSESGGGPSPYRGGGRRGGGPFRGGKGIFGHRHQRQDGGSFRGRGRGRGGGGGRRFPQSAPEVQAPYPVHAAEVPQPYAEPGTVYEPSLAAMPGPGPTLANAPSRRTPTVIFCELCRVECNSGEIFEKHKIGKRHKKNLQRLEELEHQKKQTAEADMRQRRTSAEAELQQKTEQPEYVHFDGENATTSQDAGVTDAANEITEEGGQQLQMVEQSQTLKGDMFNASAKKRKRDNIKKTPLKRKTSFVQDGKRMRVEPFRPEAPKELPVHCALCNVTCDTMAVFQCHLSGKKHASRVKWSQIQTIAYVPPTGVALYIPYGAGYGQRPPPPAVSEPVSQEGSAPITLDHQAAVTEPVIQEGSAPITLDHQAAVTEPVSQEGSAPITLDHQAAVTEPVSQEASAPITLDHQAAVTEPVSQQLTVVITEDLQAATEEPVIQQVSAMATEEYQDAAEELVDQAMPMVSSVGQNTDLEPELKDVDANNTLIPTAECGGSTS
ncbi:hypothetical protein ACLOJK_005562 [Asimina triloba]